jgi:hypothetical protein
LQGLDITLFHSGFSLLLLVIAVLLQADDVGLLFLLNLFSRLGFLAGKDLKEVCFVIDL